MLFDVVCDLNNIVITVPKICRSGSYKGLNWEKTFFDSDETANSPIDAICLGKDIADDRVYSIPITKMFNDPKSCNMVYETNDIADVHIVFLNFIIAQELVSNSLTTFIIKSLYINSITI